MGDIRRAMQEAAFERRERIPWGRAAKALEEPEQPKEDEGTERGPEVEHNPVGKLRGQLIEDQKRDRRLRGHEVVRKDGDA